MNSQKISDLGNLKLKTQQAINNNLNPDENILLIVTGVKTQKANGVFLITDERLIWVTESPILDPLIYIMYCLFGLGLGFIWLKIQDHYDLHPRTIQSMPRKILTNVNQTVTQDWNKPITTVHFDFFGPVTEQEIIFTGGDFDPREIIRLLRTNIV